MAAESEDVDLGEERNDDVGGEFNARVIVSLYEVTDEEWRGKWKRTLADIRNTISTVRSKQSEKGEFYGNNTPLDTKTSVADAKTPDTRNTEVDVESQDESRCEVACNLSSADNVDTNHGEASVELSETVEETLDDQMLKSNNECEKACSLIHTGVVDNVDNDSAENVSLCEDCLDCRRWRVKNTKYLIMRKDLTIKDFTKMLWFNLQYEVSAHAGRNQEPEEDILEEKRASEEKRRKLKLKKFNVLLFSCDGRLLNPRMKISDYNEKKKSKYLKFKYCVVKKVKGDKRKISGENGNQIQCSNGEEDVKKHLSEIPVEKTDSGAVEPEPFVKEKVRNLAAMENISLENENGLLGLCPPDQAGKVDESSRVPVVNESRNEDVFSGGNKISIEAKPIREDVKMKHENHFECEMRDPKNYESSKSNVDNSLERSTVAEAHKVQSVQNDEQKNGVKESLLLFGNSLKNKLKDNIQNGRNESKAALAYVKQASLKYLKIGEKPQYDQDSCDNEKVIVNTMDDDWLELEFSKQNHPNADKAIESGNDSDGRFESDWVDLDSLNKGIAQTYKSEREGSKNMQGKNEWSATNFEREDEGQASRFI